MSTYYKGACHDCRQWIWLSNVDMDWAQECLEHWAEHAGHEGHNIEATTEYDPLFEIHIQGLKEGKYIGCDEWETERISDPYACVNDDNGFSYNKGRFERDYAEEDEHED